MDKLIHYSNLIKSILREYDKLATSSPRDNVESLLAFDEERKQYLWFQVGWKQKLGVTPTGRATCNRLDLNDERHNEGSIVKARRLWTKGGWHPPDEDPRKSDEA